MKRLPPLLCILLTGLLTPVFGKLDGTYMNEAGMTLKTPHAAWDEKGELPHKNILFIMQQTASREVIELVQHFPGFEYEVVLTASEKSIGADDIYSNPIAGLGTADKHQELAAKLAKDYDLVVMANVDFEILPDEQKFRLMTMGGTEPAWSGFNPVNLGPNLRNCLIKNRTPNRCPGRNGLPEAIAFPEPGRKILNRVFSTPGSSAMAGSSKSIMARATGQEWG